MGKQGNSAKTSHKPLPAEKKEEKPTKREEQVVMNIKADVLSRMPTPIQENGYYVRVRQYKKTPRGFWVWANRWRIESTNISMQPLEDIIMGMDGFEGGEYRIEFFTKDDKPLPYLTCVIALGDVSESPNPANKPNPNQNHRPMNQSPYPPEDNDVRKKKASLEIKRLEIEEMELDMKKKNISGGNGEEKGELKILGMKMEQQAKDTQNLFMSGLEKIGSMFKDAITALRPAADDQVKSEIKELKELFKNMTADKAQNQIVTMMAENFKTIMAITTQQTDAQRAEAQKSQALLIELLKENGKGKPGGLDEMVKVMSSAMTRLIIPMLEFNDSRNPPAEHDLNLDRGNESKSGWDKVLEVIGKAFDQANESGFLEKIFNSKQPDGVVFTPEKVEQIKAEVTENIKKALAANNANTEVEPIDKTKKNPDVPEEVTPIKESPAFDDSDPAKSRASRVNYILKLVIEEMKVRANVVTWIDQADQNLPGDVLDEIKNAKNNAEFGDIVKKYGDKELIAQISAMTVDSPIANMKNITWLMDGVKALREILLSTEPENK